MRFISGAIAIPVLFQCASRTIVTTPAIRLSLLRSGLAMHHFLCPFFFGVIWIGGRNRSRHMRHGSFAGFPFDRLLAEISRGPWGSLDTSAGIRPEGGAICDAIFLKTDLITNLRAAAEPRDIGVNLNDISVLRQK